MISQDFTEVDLPEQRGCPYWEPGPFHTPAQDEQCALGRAWMALMWGKPGLTEVLNNVRNKNNHVKSFEFFILVRLWNVYKLGNILVLLIKLTACKT